MINYKRRKVRSETPWLDLLHIAVCAAVVVMAVFCFMDPLGNLALFPVIFLLAALLNIVAGRYHYHSAKDRGQTASAIAQTVFGFALLFFGVLSAAGVWLR